MRFSPSPPGTNGQDVAERMQLPSSRTLKSFALLACAITLKQVSLVAAPGIFDGHSDVGMPKNAGSAVASADGRTYTVAGGGTNMWFAEDAFQFVWKKVAGDVTLAA